MSKRSKKKKRQASETTHVVETEMEIGEVPDSKPPRVNGKLILLQALLIVAAGLWVFWPALRGDWLWDDDVLVTDNFQLRSWSGLGQIWFGTPVTDYWPLSWTALWIEWHLWGNDPLGYHLCNLVLHLCSGFLIWRLFNRLGLRGGWLGGLLFVIHPLAVESAAWIAEIKNVLSLPLFLLSCHAWLDGEEGRKNNGYLRSVLYYLLSVLYYLAAMLAKTSTIMLPLVLLLYGWWKRGTITWQDVRKMVPYFVIALVLGLITIHFQNHRHETAPVEMGSYFTRLLGAGMAICFYLEKFLWPTELLPIYPSWALDPPSLLALVIVPLLAGLFFGLWTQRKSWGRHALFGFGFFVLNLLPVLGFIKMEYLTISPVADHLVYLPIIGLIGLVVAVFGQAKERLAPTLRPVGVGIVAAIIALLAWESCGYAGLYINQETLWNYTVQRNPQAYIARNNLGNALAQSGRLAEAIEQYEQALQIKPDFIEAHNNLGDALQQSKRMTEAIQQYQEALRLKPDFAEAHYNLGNALLLTGRMEEAIKEYQEALWLKPDNAKAHGNLGVALQQTGRISEAITQYEQALQLKPEDVTARSNLGDALLQTGRVAEAMEQCEQALQLKPDYAEAHNNLGDALQQSGRIEEAIKQYQEALQLKPDYTEARNNLARAQTLQKTAPVKK